MSKNISKILLIGFLATALFSCSDSENEGANVEAFNRTGLLENLAENYIINGYQTASQSALALQATIGSFVANPTETQLESVREQFKTAYLDWQAVSFLEFGPAANGSLRSNLNTYPTSAEKIEGNIVEGNWNLNAFDNVTAKGFPALDYLLFANSASETVASFEADPAKAAYLQDLSSNIAELLSNTANAWETENGNYAANFIAADGTDVGSGIGLLINNLNQHYERNTRDGKVGIPVGIRSVGIARPDLVEAPYAGFSKELAIANISAMKAVFNGQEGLGFDDYLLALGHGDLSNEINAQFDIVTSQLGQLESDLAVSINQEKEVVEALYVEMQKLVVLLKTDMPSILGVLITFQDNDGD